MYPSKRQRTEENIKTEEQNSNTDQPSTSIGSNLEWRESTKLSKERHKYALKQGILTDVTFSVGPEKQEFQAHKIILALASPVFEVMFYGSLKETNDKIVITDLMPSGFQGLLDYIYTDAVNFINETEAFSAWIAADKYCLSHMRDMCYNYLYQCLITNNNVWIILENSLFLDSPLLVERCLSYLKKNIEDAILVPSFFETSCETVKRVVMMDSLFIKEIDLLKNVVRWSKEKIKNGSSEEPLKDVVQPFLKYIRFPCMTQPEFVQFIDTHTNIISDSDTIAIIKFMTNPALYSLPDWCSNFMHPRCLRIGRQNYMSFRSSPKLPLHTSTSNSDPAYRSRSNLFSSPYIFSDSDRGQRISLDPPRPSRRRSRENRDRSRENHDRSRENRDNDYFRNSSSDDDEINHRNLSPVNYSSDSSSSSPSSVSSTSSSSTNSGLSISSRLSHRPSVFSD